MHGADLAGPVACLTHTIPGGPSQDAAGPVNGNILGSRMSALYKMLGRVVTVVRPGSVVQIQALFSSS